MTKPRGFTLIELLIVVAIIGVLAAIAVPNFLQAHTKAQVTAVISEMKVLEQQLRIYWLDFGRPPVSDYIKGKNSIVGISTPVAYMPNIPTDPFRADRQDYKEAYGYFYNYWYNEEDPSKRYNRGGTEWNSQGWVLYLYSLGPNFDDNTRWVTYNPSNGIRSTGVVRLFTPKRTEDWQDLL